MIRQRGSAAWRALVETKGSLEEQLEFVAIVRSYRDDWAVRKQALTAQYKENLQDPAYLAAKAALQAEAEAQLLAFGFYEEVTESELDTEFVENIREAVLDRPHLIPRVITRVTNFYRSQNGKEDLKEAQVRSRLLAA